MMKKLYTTSILLFISIINYAGEPISDSLIIRGEVYNYLDTGKNRLLIEIENDAEIEFNYIEIHLQKGGEFEFKIHRKHINNKLVYYLKSNKKRYTSISLPIRQQHEVLNFKKVPKHFWSFTPSF